MTWVVAALSLLATYLNVRKNVASYWLWTLTNGVWAAMCFSHELPAQGCLHLAYLALAIWGISCWRRKVPAPSPD